MKIDIVTLFPAMFEGPFNESIIKRAVAKEAVTITLHDLRKWGVGKHRTVDDRPYGGGPGMLMMVEPIFNALAEIDPHHNAYRIFTTPQGETFIQESAMTLSKKSHILIMAGHYEGLDQRARDNLFDAEISIGDYVLTGGELPAMVIVDSIVRLLPGVLKKDDATQEESFTLEDESGGLLLEYPQYTRPEYFNGWEVPDVLLSGDHKKIQEWNRKNSKKK